MPRFIKLAEEAIPNFAGIKYTSGDLEQGYQCLKFNSSIFLGADTVLCGALALGFESMIMTSLNIFPEMSYQIIEKFNKGQVDEARSIQVEMNNKITKILQRPNKKGAWVPCMKEEFNVTFKSMPLGQPRIAL